MPHSHLKHTNNIEADKPTMNSPTSVIVDMNPFHIEKNELMADTIDKKIEQLGLPDLNLLSRYNHLRSNTQTLSSILDEISDDMDAADLSDNNPLLGNERTKSTKQAMPRHKKSSSFTVRKRKDSPIDFKIYDAPRYVRSCTASSISISDAKCKISSKKRHHRRTMTFTGGETIFISTVDSRPRFSTN